VEYLSTTAAKVWRNFYQAILKHNRVELKSQYRQGFSEEET
jgi:hypothetical protein